MESNNASPLLTTTNDRAKEEGGRKRSLKHKHKQKATDESNGDESAPKPKSKPLPFVKDDPSGHLQDLLTSKIAQLQVGDESLDVDMGGLFSDDKFVDKARISWDECKGDDEAMDAAVRTMLGQMTLLQKKMGEMHSKYIVMREQKAALAETTSKVTATKGKLESLCRELQKQNKTIITESRRIAEEEDAKRKQLSLQFQTTIEDVSKKMEQQGKDYVASLQDNEALQGKLKTFLSQYEMREEHFAHQLQAKDLAVQLAEAKLQHQIELTNQETKKVAFSLDKAKQISDREVLLQDQLSSYSEKFEVVQETLSKSNTMFVTLREEMDKMSKHIKRLEKENTSLKKKCDQYDHGAIEMLQERGRAAEEAKRQQDKISKLEGLCRMLQAERNRLKEQATNDTAS
ncbi:Aste57867_20388 [Aphanomyces stellatus]|uniref:Aste57867_20388 protein n=1 Tax=Aphanomyces stellatus TaxID=120398 RepID=A0A485LFK1_9STRA|nr:hypothetical protein As57867_020322 [Aphanomyces stellatus]VFT97074.1 Aste57867_20388 [Aphanomyces stellatus]